MRSVYIWALLAFISLPLSSTENLYEKAMQAAGEVDVLLVSDHTLPEHLSISSGGANGEERLYIDPTLVSFTQKLMAHELNTYTLNVEDMTADGNIADKATFEAAYGRYDEVLKKAVAHGATIVAIHYDADIIPAEDYGENAAYDSASEDGAAKGYIGGIQLILDKRSAGEATLRLADQLIHQDKILAVLHETGLRYRPDYDDEIRFQNNLTLNITGASKGGTFLLEIGAQDQATRLFGDPEGTVKAIDQALEKLAASLSNFRQSEGL